MITIFNRAQLCVTQSLEQCSKLTAALDAAGIRYYAKALSRSSPAASARGPSRRTWPTTIFTGYTSVRPILSPRASACGRPCAEISRLK